MRGTHLFLAPHADDVPLSCGGWVGQLAQQGADVHVLSLMVADPPHPLPASPFITDLHQRWATSENPYAVRRAEDTGAVEHLGAKVHFGDWLDCIYRTDAQGNVLYQNDDELFGAIQSNDPLNDTDLTLPSIGNIDYLYIPLGAGNHVDHQVVRNKAFAWVKSQQNQSLEVFGYAEYPYSSEAGEVMHSHGGTGTRLAGATATQTALQAIQQNIELAVRPLNTDDINRKIEALLHYKSQISTFWESVAVMRERVWQNAQVVGQAHGIEYAERLWRLTLV